MPKGYIKKQFIHKYIAMHKFLKQCNLKIKWGIEHHLGAYHNDTQTSCFLTPFWKRTHDKGSVTSSYLAIC